MTQQSTTSNNWNDFNDAESQQSGFDLIPKGTVVAVRMTLKPGGYDDPSQGWSGGYATESFDTGSIYLAAEFDPGLLDNVLSEQVSVVDQLDWDEREGVLRAERQRKVGELVTVHVIPRPHGSLEDVLPIGKSSQNS